MTDLNKLELNNQKDYKFFAYLIAEKLRNPAFEPKRR